VRIHYVAEIHAGQLQNARDVFRPEAVLPWLAAESAQMLHGAGSIPILSFTADAIR